MEKGGGHFQGRGWRLWLPSRGGGFLPLLFLLFISLPALNEVFHFVPPFRIFEKRTLAARPSFDLRRPFAYLPACEEYYNDHFTFRTRWVYWNNLLTYKIFRTAATPKVVIGRQGWLFLGNAGEYFDEIDYYRNVKPFSQRELRYWQVLLEERRAWLRRRGIEYVFMVAPNKSTVYPEFLPASVRKIHPQSRLDQLIAFLGKHSTLRILDLRPALREAKTLHAAYHQTDTHWNDWGGYVAYRELMRRLQARFPAAQPRPPEDFRFRRRVFRDGDLALMLTLPDIFWENELQFVARAPLRARVTRENDEELRDKRATLSVHTCAGGRLPAAVMVHDSFANPMKPFLSEDFSKIVYIWNWQLNFFDRVIEREGARIVIDEMVEYSMLNRVPVNPPGLRRQFR